MIRKILLAVTLVYFVFWFASAYLIKRRVVEVIFSINSDEIKISYNNVTISGFPLKWDLKITDLEVKLTKDTSLLTISNPSLAANFDFSLKEIVLVLDKNIKYNYQAEGKNLNYTVAFTKEIQTSLTLFQSLVLPINKDHLANNIAQFIFNNEEINVFEQEVKICTFYNNGAFLKKAKVMSDEVISLAFDTSYKGNIPDIEFNTAAFSFNGDLVINQSNPSTQKRFLKSINLKELNIDLKDAKITANGEISFFKNRFPEGQISIDLVNYFELIDLLVPKTFLSTDELKKNIAKLMGAEEIDNELLSGTIDKDAKLQVIFKDPEVTINGKKISDINLNQ